MSYIKEIIDKLHFDYEAYNLEKNLDYDIYLSWQDMKHNDENVEDYLVTDQLRFQENLDVIIDDEEVDKIVFALSEDKDNIAKLVNLFNHYRYLLCKSNIKEENKIKNCLNELIEHGISKINLFNEEDLGELTHFQAQAEQQIGDDVKFAGYVRGHLDPSFGRPVYNAKSSDNDGQLRMQSKNLLFEIPGIKPLINNKELKNIFSKWYNVGEMEVNFVRQNIEWISPAPINHNKWHLDTLRDQLKVMVLLNDVNYDAAPMFYAMGSHNCTTNLEKEKKSSLFTNETKILKNKSKHEGYISDNDVNNYLDKITSDNKKVTIRDNQYNNLICTGHLGDCFLFESSGFHSGNRARLNVRKSIVLTTETSHSYKNKFLDRIGKLNC